jgi:tripartite-type tricarboxylate transporter receptor subunit TctC
VAVFPPGGSVDQVARILAPQLSQQLGQTVIVENKGGASGSIGTAAVASAAPDGYTFAVVFDTHAVNPSLIPNLPYAWSARRRWCWRPTWARSTRPSAT